MGLQLPKQKKSAAKSRATVIQQAATDYADIVIFAQRKNASSIEISVYASPVGPTSHSYSVLFSAAEAKKIRDKAYSTIGCEQAGRMEMTQAEATELGKRLAEVLLPPAVFRVLAQSLAIVLQKPSGGLRIRLALDESLIDLPWEYVYRPDHLEREGVSGFLLLDPRISLVREAANPHISIEPITGSQQLAFIGTFWEGMVDRWSVKTEFNRLESALKSVSQYITPTFTAANQATAFGKHLTSKAAIVHYGGHCDFDVDSNQRAYLIREMPNHSPLKADHKVYLDELASVLSTSGTRLVVLSACNSGFWPAVKPLLDVRIPAIVGIHGGVASDSTIEFCAKLYESLAIGLSLDEAVGRARMHLLEWGQQYGLFDWGLYMVYMPSPQSVLFPRQSNAAVKTKQKEVRRKHNATIKSTLELVETLDGNNFGQILSQLNERRVLILGRFIGRRLKILKAIQKHLAKHSNKYIPELFTFDRPKSRDLIESIVGFAALSRFIIADLSEPRSVQAELQAIVPVFQSIPIVPILSRTGKEYATFASLQRKENVIKPTVRYRDEADLLQKLDQEVVPKAEAMLKEVLPPAP